MIFNREDLITRVEECIGKMQSEQMEKHYGHVEKWEADVEDWKTRYADKWRAYAQTILDVIDQQGEAITETNGKPPQYDGETPWRGAAFLRHSKRPELEAPNTTELDQLLVALKADTGKTVSQSALESLGFRKLKDMGLFK